MSKPRVTSDYMDRYKAWKEAQVCIGCNAKSCSDVGWKPDEDGKQWMTEYLCMPCWSAGVRGEPAQVFEGYSGSIRPGELAVTKP